MYYYGLEFHDLALNFVFNISAFIVVCEAFLRIKPHFGLWLKIVGEAEDRELPTGRMRRCHGG